MLSLNFGTWSRQGMKQIPEIQVEGLTHLVTQFVTDSTSAVILSCKIWPCDRAFSTPGLKQSVLEELACHSLQRTIQDMDLPIGLAGP
jgi:hypothetical protein